MFLIEATNRVKALKNLHQRPKLYPFLDMERIHHWGRANPKAVGCSFWGDDTDVTGLIMADTAPWYAGPFDQKSVAAILACLANMESRIADQKKYYAQFLDDVQPDIQNIVSTVDRYRQTKVTNQTFGYAEHLMWLHKQVAKIGKRPPIARDVVFRAEANRAAKLIAGKIVRP